MGLVLAGANAFAATLGWCGSQTYALPVPASLDGLWPALFVALVLTGYRWLLAHAQRARQVHGLIVLVVLAPFVVVVGTWRLGTGRVSFGGGSMIWQEVLLGQTLRWLLVLFDEAARRRWARHGR
jgi:hypothetical protein